MEDAMTKDILIVVRHGPYGGFQAAEALRHANGSISLIDLIESSDRVIGML